MAKVGFRGDVNFRSGGGRGEQPDDQGERTNQRDEISLGEFVNTQNRKKPGEDRGDRGGDAGRVCLQPNLVGPAGREIGGDDPDQTDRCDDHPVRHVQSELGEDQGDNRGERGVERDSMLLIGHVCLDLDFHLP